MKTAGAVYKKLREVKYKHLTELYKKLIRRQPDRCKYNKAYRIETDGVVKEIRLCMLHQPTDGGLLPHLLDICQETKHCEECNAFISIHTKESVKALFEEELASSAKSKKYPDICALEWVLDQPTAVGPLSWLEKAWLWIKRQSGFYPFS